MKGTAIIVKSHPMPKWFCGHKIVRFQQATGAVVSMTTNIEGVLTWKGER